MWFDRTGKRIGELGPPADYGAGGINLSPDGARVLATRTGGVGFSEPRAWVAEVTRGIFSRLVSGEGSENLPVISRSGRAVFTSTFSGAAGDLYWMPASGIGAPEPLLVKSPTVKHPNHISPDDRFLVFDDHSPQQRQDLWILPLDPGNAEAPDDRKPIPFLVTDADETFGQFSPDGRWIAYSSDESGRREVYVQGFAPDRVPATAIGKWQISTAGGDKPRWRRVGSELYYLALDGKLMAVPVKLGSTFDAGIAAPLFEVRVVGFAPYDVAADGRFLILTPTADTMSASSPVTVVLNWQAGLQAR